MTEAPANIFPNSVLTGVAAIDEEHRALFARIRAGPNGPDPSNPENLALFLKSLIDEFAQHFAHEERLMAASKFVHAAGHASAHARLLERLRQSLGTTEADRATLVHTPFDALDALFRDALQGDAEFANWLASKEFRPAPQAG